MDIQLDIFDVEAIAAYVRADCPADITRVWVDIDVLEDLHMDNASRIASLAIRYIQWNSRYGV